MVVGISSVLPLVRMIFAPFTKSNKGLLTMQRSVVSTEGASPRDRLTRNIQEVELEAATERRKRPVNLTIFVTVALLLCLVTWGLDHSYFQINEYQNVHEVYSKLGVNIFSEELYMGLSERTQKLTDITLITSSLVLFVWGLSAYIYVTRCRSIHAVNPPPSRFMVKSHKSDIDFSRHEKN